MLRLLVMCCLLTLGCSTGSQPGATLRHDTHAELELFADGNNIYALEKYPTEGTIRFDVIITWCGQEDLFSDDFSRVKLFWNSSYIGAGDDGIAELLRRTELLPRGSVLGMRSLYNVNQPTFPDYPISNDKTSIESIAEAKGLRIILIPDLKQ